MYFKKPGELQELFENLEERNLFIIKNSQDIEQSLEDLKHNFELKKEHLIEREKQLKKNKQELERAIQVIWSLYKPNVFSKEIRALISFIMLKMTVISRLVMQNLISVRVYG